MKTQILDSYTKDSACKIFSVQKIRPETVITDIHRHSFYQIIILKKGMIKHFIDYEMKTAVNPFIAVVFPNQIHRIIMSPDAELDVVMFDSSVFCSALLANELRDYNVDLQNRINHVDNVLADEWNVILSLVEHIRLLSSQLTMIKKLEVKFLIKTILLKIIEMAPKNGFTTSMDTDVQLYLNFRELLSKGVYLQKKVRNYAEELGVTTKKLTAICNKYTGRTPLDIIHEHLLRELKRAVLEDGVLLKELSFRYGFSSQSALNKFIERKYGCSPQEWKEKLEKDVLG